MWDKLGIRSWKTGVQITSYMASHRAVQLRGEGAGRGAYNGDIDLRRMSAARLVMTQDQIIPLLMESCPSFRAVVDEHQQENGEEILYVLLSGFARHLLQLHQQHQTEAFPAVAEAIERMHVEGDPFVRESATIGLLEGIQNVWNNADVDPELFARHLLPESARWWRSLQDFWSGRSKFVGDGL